MLIIRPVETEDVPLLSEFWYDNMALIQQSNPRVRLLPDARHQWEQAAKHLIQAADTAFLAAEVDTEVLGCIAGRIAPNQPGLTPTRIGMIDFLILDLHTPHKQQGTGRQLLQAVKTHFIERSITQLQVSISAQSTVAQAFWLGVGAKKTDEIYWMKL